jgi:hypothetical protein
MHVRTSARRASSCGCTLRRVARATERRRRRLKPPDSDHDVRIRESGMGTRERPIDLDGAREVFDTGEQVPRGPPVPAIAAAEVLELRL